MAFDDRPKLPRAIVRDEKLYVEGEKEPYFQDREHTIRLRVDALTVYRGYVPEHLRKPAGAKVLTESLHGTARLEDGNRFALIGLETDRKTRINFLLRTISDNETEHHWQAGIGFTPHDWEFPDWEEQFWIEGYCRKQYLDDLLAAVRRGHVDNIRVGMETTMWTKDRPSMYGINPRTWHIAPPIDRDDAKDHALANGNISSLIWEEKFGIHPTRTEDEAPTKTEDEATAPKPQLVELPARVYSMLTALVAIAAALLVLTFLRQH